MPSLTGAPSFSHIARRHGHVFRMALHNEGHWRMETWQRACRASCHVSIRQSPSCVMPFWTHAKCLLAFISYLPMWIKAKYTFIKTVYSPRFYGGPYLQAKHADVCSGVLFWTACTRRPHVLSLPSSSGCEKSDSWRQARSVKTAKKVMNGTTMWSCDTELCTNGVEATTCRVFVAHFSIYSTSRYRCHTGTDITRLRGHTLQINQVVRTVRHRISCCAPTIHWKCDAQIQNRQIKSPPALWKHLSFQCLGIIVTLNGKSASMLLEPTKNKLKQWRVIEKSVNKCNFFSQMFWIITKWMKITEKQICEDQIVTFKQSHILLYQGLLFLTRSTCVIVDAGSHTCKSHDFIPRYDIIDRKRYLTCVCVLFIGNCHLQVNPQLWVWVPVCVLNVIIKCPDTVGLDCSLRPTLGIMISVALASPTFASRRRRRRRLCWPGSQFLTTNFVTDDWMLSPRWVP